MKIEALKDCVTPSHTLKKGMIVDMRASDAEKLIAKKLAKEVTKEAAKKPAKKATEKKAK